jgi:hypothetical protein
LFFTDFGAFIAAEAAPEVETAGPSSLYAITCSNAGRWTWLAGQPQQQNGEEWAWSGWGWGGGEQAGSGDGGAAWLVRSCCAALRTWRSYIKTIQVVCVRSDGECDQ